MPKRRRRIPRNRRNKKRSYSDKLEDVVKSACEKLKNTTVVLNWKTWTVSPDGQEVCIRTMDCADRTSWFNDDAWLIKSCEDTKEWYARERKENTFTITRYQCCLGGFKGLPPTWETSADLAETMKNLYDTLSENRFHDYMMSAPI